MKLFLIRALSLMCLAVSYGVHHANSQMPTGGPWGMMGIPLPIQAALYDVDLWNIYRAEMVSQLLGGSPWARMYAGNLYDMPNYYWLTSGAGMANGQMGGAMTNPLLLTALAASN